MWYEKSKLVRLLKADFELNYKYWKIYICQAVLYSHKIVHSSHCLSYILRVQFHNKNSPTVLCTYIIPSKLHACCTSWNDLRQLGEANPLTKQVYYWVLTLLEALDIALALAWAITLCFLRKIIWVL